ncbi:MAG: hypothetical protein ABR961_09595 [Thermoanaerobaculaceae bacterium]|jgi:hypothetical protein
MKLASRVVCLVAIALLLSNVPARAADWKPLGQRVVDYSTNPVSIEAATGAGPFSKLRLDVREANLKISDVRVTFTDGQAVSLDVNKFVVAGSSCIIDLPSAKEVQRVEFSYRKVSNSGDSRIALVKLLGSV